MSTSTENPTFSDVLAIQSNPEDLFTLIHPIGIGGYGKVYKAMHNATLKLFAIKIIDYTKHGLQDKNKISFNYNSVQEETALMRLLQKNDFIVQYYGSYYSRKSNTIWLILEYCSCGSLIDLMYSIDRRFSEIEIASFIEMVLKGLIFLHDLNIMHRDIKAQNILLTEDGTAKLGDFGVGAKLTEEEYRHSKKGSPYWMSPQVVLQKDYSIETDIWSLGITCVELAESEPPFADLKPLAVMNKIGKNPPKVEDVINVEEYSESFVDFIRKCIVVDRNKRITAKELIEHEFIKKNSKGKKFVGDLIKRNLQEIKDYMDEKSRELEKKNNQNNNNDSLLNVDDVKEILNINENKNQKEPNENNNESIEEKISNKEKSISDNNENNENNINEELYSEKNEISSTNKEENNYNNNNILNNDNNNENEENEENDELNDGSMIIKEDVQNEEITTIIDDAKKILDKIEDNINDNDINNFNNEEKKEEEEKEKEIDYNRQKLEEMQNMIREKLRGKIKKEEKNIAAKKVNININNMKTPSKKNIINIYNNESNYNDNNNNYSMNIIDKANSQIKALLLNEKHKNKKINNISSNNIFQKRSQVTTGFTGSKTDSSDGKKIICNKILFPENNNNINNNIYTKKKIDFINHDISNIDDDSDEEEINPVKQIFNLNYEDNKFEKCFTERKYINTSIKQNKFNILDKIKIDNYLSNSNINSNDEHVVRNIHFSAYKEHKKYFN